MSDRAATHSSHGCYPKYEMLHDWTSHLFSLLPLDRRHQPERRQPAQVAHSPDAEPQRGSIHKHIAGARAQS